MSATVAHRVADVTRFLAACALHFGDGAGVVNIGDVKASFFTVVAV